MLLTRLKIDANTEFEKLCEKLLGDCPDSIHAPLYYKVFKPLATSTWESTNEEIHNQLIDEVDKTARRFW